MVAAAGHPHLHAGFAANSGSRARLAGGNRKCTETERLAKPPVMTGCNLNSVNWSPVCIFPSQREQGRPARLAMGEVVQRSGSAPAASILMPTELRTKGRGGPRDGRRFFASSFTLAAALQQIATHFLPSARPRVTITADSLFTPHPVQAMTA